MRKTSICGLGQVALGPVVSVLRLDRPAADVTGQSVTVGREFFTAKTVAEALAGFRPARRTAARERGAVRGRSSGLRRRHRLPRDPAGIPALDDGRLCGTSGRHLRLLRGASRLPGPHRRGANGTGRGGRRPRRRVRGRPDGRRASRGCRRRRDGGVHRRRRCRE